MTQTHAQASQRIRHHLLTLQDTTVSRSRVKIKTSRKIYDTFVRTTTPSYIIGSIWKLLLLSRRHKNLHVMNTLPPTHSGMNDKQQALFLSKLNQKHSKKGTIIAYSKNNLFRFVLLFNMLSFRFFLFYSQLQASLVHKAFGQLLEKSLSNFQMHITNRIW